MEITCQVPISATYQREVGHCEPTKYARPVTVKEVKDAQNASALDIVTFEEMGWQAVVAERLGLTTEEIDGRKIENALYKLEELKRMVERGDLQ